MKQHCILLMLICMPAFLSAQVGIGTNTPNTKALLDLSSSNKGLLLPRLTSSDRVNMQLTTADAGMMVYQSNGVKGIYSFNGTTWIYHAPMDGGVVNGSTLRWDGSKWQTVTNFFNQGFAIGIGTTNPNNLLHLNTTSVPYNRIQFTNSATGPVDTDGLIMGISNNNAVEPGAAHIVQQEENDLWLGTNAVERIRIKASGDVGIGTNEPDARLDVNGTVRLGAEGSILHGIMRNDFVIDPPVMDNMSEWSVTVDFPHATMDAVVYASPGIDVDGMAICYSRVSAPNSITIKLMNMSTQIDPPAFTMHVAVIQ